MTDLDDKFEVTVTPNRHDDLGHMMKVTHNGYQWSAINFNLEQAAKIQAALTLYIGAYAINTVTGAELDDAAKQERLHRARGETDADFRTRIQKHLSKEPFG